MALKKNFFKKLQNNISISPIKQNGVGVDKKYPNIVKEVDNNSIQDGSNWRTARINAEEITRRNNINTNYNEAVLNKALKQNPNIDQEALRKYMFSNKPGLNPEEYAIPKGGVSSPDRLAMKDRLAPSDALVLEDGDRLAPDIPMLNTFDLHSLQADTNMMNMSLNEKKQYLNKKLNARDFDLKNKGDVYERDSKQNFIDWYTDPITQQRLLEQAQGVGNIRSEELGGNVAGNLLSQGNIDGMLSNSIGAGFNFESMGNLSSTEKGNYFGYVKPSEGYDDSDLKMNSQIPFDPDSGFGEFGGHNLININKGNLNVAPPGGDPSFGSFSNQIGGTTQTKRTKQQTGFHELAHYTGLDKAMDPYLRSILKRPENKIGEPVEDREKYYSKEPGEMYANFIEFRKMINMNPGDQFNEKSFKKVLKDNDLENDEFVQQYDTSSLIKALNTVAEVDKTVPGKTKFNDLQMMQGNMNTEVA
tara:strand:+ start:4405 stop:5826 length:1422 start_codon:yes stop_codon:yes gene_type:complete